MNITSVLYCVVIHRCYTSVILHVNVILLFLYTPVYSVPIRNVILMCITEEYTRYTVLYNNAFYTVKSSGIALRSCTAI